MKTLDVKQDERVYSLAREVVDVCTGMLFVDMPFLDTAIFRLTFKADRDDAVQTWATDGSVVYYKPQHVLRRYADRDTSVAHDIMHVVLHCVFRHMFVEEIINQRLWNLACDIAVEAIIASLNFRNLIDGRETMRGGIVEEVINIEGAITAEKVYRILCDRAYSDDDLYFMEEAFYVDEHHWFAHSKKNANVGEQDGEGDGDRDGDDQEEGDQGTQKPGGDQEANPYERLEQEWEEAAKNVETGLETLYGRSERGIETGDLLQALKTVNRQHYDYKAFLRGFTTLGEQMQLNDEEFDVVFYTYGLDRYGDMPLIEPLEHKEVKRLRDIALVLDTSGSVSGELLQHLFERTFDLIMSESNTFKRFRIHLIQCDTQVKEDLLLQSREDLERAVETFTFKGLGGTDFTAAFSYVDELVAAGEFVNFKGLICFTDGRAKFPATMPAYRSAFVFLTDDYDDQAVPPWAMKLVLSSDEVRQL